jgi:hypothetical protein
MVDITITAANVVAGANALIERGTAGATITAGQEVYKESSSGKFKLADSNGASAEIRTPYGTALNGASDGQPLAVQKTGDITIGAALTAGLAYYLSDTPGGICPVADIGAGEYVAIVGVAKSTTVLDLIHKATGVSL